jgi:hypothetical protein
MSTTISGTAGVSKVQDGAADYAALAAGMVVQSLIATDNSYLSSSSAIHTGGDASVAAANGYSVLTLTITPKIIGSKLIVRGHANVGQNTACSQWLSLHNGSTADAFAQSLAYIDANVAGTAWSMDVVGTITTTSLSPITIYMRASVSGGTVYINGTSSGHRGGAASLSVLTIEEVKQ